MQGNPLSNCVSEDLVPYLAIAKKRAIIIEVPKDLSSRGYDMLFRRLAKAMRCGNLDLSLTDLRRCEVTNSGVFFDWGLAGPSGAYFELFQVNPVAAFDSTKIPAKYYKLFVTETQVDNAKKEIRSQRDVVCLRVKIITRISYEDYEKESV